MSILEFMYWNAGGIICRDVSSGQSRVGLNITACDLSLDETLSTEDDAFFHIFDDLPGNDGFDSLSQAQTLNVIQFPDQSRTNLIVLIPCTS
jgi:hypothetical protein